MKLSLKVSSGTCQNPGLCDLMWHVTSCDLMCDLVWPYVWPHVTLCVTSCDLMCDLTWPHGTGGTFSVPFTADKICSVRKIKYSQNFICMQNYSMKQNCHVKCPSHILRLFCFSRNASFYWSFQRTRFTFLFLFHFLDFSFLHFWPNYNIIFSLICPLSGI